MIYSLTCGNCGTANNVSADDDPISWTCRSCSNDSITSLPRTTDGDLITDPTKAKAILTSGQAQAAKDIVIAEVMN